MANLMYGTAVFMDRGDMFWDSMPRHTVSEWTW